MQKDRVILYLEPTSNAKADRIAKAEHLSKSAWLRQRVEKMLADIPDPEPSGDKVPA